MIKLCECGCGEKTTISNHTHMIRGVKKGDYNRFVTSHSIRPKTHGLSNTKIFGIWRSMKTRCLNKNDKSYHNYGGRGISICDRWMKFKNFFADMGNAPPGLTLDRKDNNGNYEPGNCRWATRKEQSHNSRRSTMIEFNGIRDSVNGWAKRFGMSTISLRYRLKKLSLEEVLIQHQPKPPNGESNDKP